MISNDVKICPTRYCTNSPVTAATGMIAAPFSRIGQAAGGRWNPRLAPLAEDCNAGPSRGMFEPPPPEDALIIFGPGPAAADNHLDPAADCAPATMALEAAFVWSKATFFDVKAASKAICLAANDLLIINLCNSVCNI